MGAGFNVSNLLGDLYETHLKWIGGDWSERVIVWRSILGGWDERYDSRVIIEAVAVKIIYHRRAVSHYEESHHRSSLCISIKTCYCAIFDVLCRPKSVTESCTDYLMLLQPTNNASRVCHVNR